MPRPLFFLFVWDRKKRSGGSPLEFLCSGIYNFGKLIAADEQQKPTNGARMGKRRMFSSTLKSKGRVRNPKNQLLQFDPPMFMVLSHC